MRISNGIFQIGGGPNSSTLSAVELNMTVDELITLETDTFSNDAGAVSIIFRIIDNTSTTYISTHTLSPTQDNEQVVYTLGSGASVAMTFEDGVYGEGTLAVAETTSADVIITGFSVTRNDSRTNAFFFGPADALNFSALRFNYSGPIGFIRG